MTWADEIVVVDSGSTDRTVAICREYTDKVIHQDWLGFARQKNLAIDRTTGDWVLSLDADEPIEPMLAEEIRDIIASPAALDGYYIPRKTFFLGKQVRHGGWYPDYNLRLFRKGRGRFEERAVHEAIKVRGQDRAGQAMPSCIMPIRIWPRTCPPSTSIPPWRLRSWPNSGISGLRQAWLNILLRPVFTFLLKYIFRLGFLDGKHGLVLNLFHSYYVFAKYAKAWEHGKFNARMQKRGSEK